MYSKNGKQNFISINEVENCQRTSYSNIESTDAILDFNFICKNLKYEDRIIIILYYLEQFTDKEIGKILGFKENTIKTKRTRAIQKIRNIMNKGEEVYE